jgi:hypothetical protein
MASPISTRYFASLAKVPTYLTSRHGIYQQTHHSYDIELDDGRFCKMSLDIYYSLLLDSFLGYLLCFESRLLGRPRSIVYGVSRPCNCDLTNDQMDLTSKSIVVKGQGQGPIESVPTE